MARFALTLGGAPHLWPTYFMGQPTTGDPGLLFYPISMALRLGPVATIGLVLLLIAGLVVRWPRLLAIPAALLLVWIGGALLVRALRLRRRAQPDAGTLPVTPQTTVNGER